MEEVADDVQAFSGEIAIRSEAASKDEGQAWPQELPGREGGPGGDLPPQVVPQQPERPRPQASSGFSGGSGRKAVSRDPKFRTKR